MEDLKDVSKIMGKATKEQLYDMVSFDTYELHRRKLNPEEILMANLNMVVEELGADGLRELFGNMLTAIKLLREERENVSRT